MAFCLWNYGLVFCSYGFVIVSRGLLLDGLLFWLIIIFWLTIISSLYRKMRHFKRNVEVSVDHQGAAHVLGVNLQ